MENNPLIYFIIHHKVIGEVVRFVANLRVGGPARARLVLGVSDLCGGFELSGR